MASAGLAGSKRASSGAQPPRQPEVQNLHQAAVGQHHVLRLQVAVKDAQRMRRLQPVGNLDAHREHQLQVRRPALDQLVQRLARHILHGDVGLVAALAHLVDGAHIGMLDGRRQPRLAQHRRAHLLGRQQARCAASSAPPAAAAACRWPRTPRRCLRRPAAAESRNVQLSFASSLISSLAAIA